MLLTVGGPYRCPGHEAATSEEERYQKAYGN